MSKRHYCEVVPCQALRHLVACYWRFWVVGEGTDPLTHHVPPDGGVNIVLTPRRRAPVLLSGPRTEPQTEIVLPGQSWWGIRFWPGAGGVSLNIDSAGLVNQTRPLAAVDPGLASELTRALGGGWELEPVGRELDAVLSSRLAGVGLDARVMEAVGTILQARGQLAIAGLVRSSGLSERQFQRRFRRAVGLTPKELARVRRIRAAAIEVLEQDTPLAQVACGYGFADQAHLIREFQDLIGQSPRSFRDTIRKIEHGDYAS